MASSLLRTATTRTTVALALGGLALLTGCEASTDAGQRDAGAASSAPVAPSIGTPVPVPSTASPAPSVEPVAKAPVTPSPAVKTPVRPSPVPVAKAPVTPSSSPVAAKAPVKPSAAQPACPDGAGLFALLPADERAGNRVAPGPATCAGTWAVVGVLHQGGQSVALFSSATGSWRPADAARACAAKALPAALVDGVCNAG